MAIHQLTSAFVTFRTTKRAYSALKTYKANREFLSGPEVQRAPRPRNIVRQLAFSHLDILISDLAKSRQSRILKARLQLVRDPHACHRICGQPRPVGRCHRTLQLRGCKSLSMPLHTEKVGTGEVKRDERLTRPAASLLATRSASERELFFLARSILAIGRYHPAWYIGSVRLLSAIYRANSQ